MKQPSNTIRTMQDRLVRRYQLSDGRTVSVGKRVPATCKLTREELRVYVEGDVIKAVFKILTNRKIPLHEALALLNEVRGGRQSWKRVEK